MAALEYGVDSIVLRWQTPIEVRREVSSLLNATHDIKWNVDAEGKIDINSIEAAPLQSQFECLSKSLDSVDLSALVRFELGIHQEERSKPALLSKL